MALIAFDGTGCTDHDDEKQDSNVVKFCDAYEGDPALYLPGIGTRGRLIQRGFGSAFGKGGFEIIDEAMQRLDDSAESAISVTSRLAEATANATDDEAFDVVGYSRGAALALHFANALIEKRQKVRFLGLFDTVPSFGIPGAALNKGWDLELPNDVGASYHAMALHERRGTFNVTRVGKATEEVWFRGVHSDIGGAGNLQLSSITLCWMLKHARNARLPIKAAAIAYACGKGDPTGALSPRAIFDKIEDPWRVLQSGDHVHDSVGLSVDPLEADFASILEACGLTKDDLKPAEPVN